jgi:regulator of replication initiation timing
MDPHSRFEIESELESLRKEISDLKTSITKNLNENLMKELALLESARI